MRIKLLAALCPAIAVLVPAAVSVTEDSGYHGCGTKGSTCSGFTLVQQTLPDPSVVLAAPADGTVVSWSVIGSGTLKLRVLRPVGGSVIAAGTSAAATDLMAGANPTSLPIRAGDVVGVDLVSPSALGDVIANTATMGKFSPRVPDDGLADAPTETLSDFELLYNATIVLTPSIAALTPTSGSTTGGETIKILGSNLDGATGVSFGSKAATFTVDSPNQITATAPAAPASTVDVRVSSPGGTSAVNDGDKYTFTAAGPGAPGPIGPSLISPLTTAGKPTLSALGQSASKWRRGHQQAKISRAPLGTTFSFTLSKAATVKLAFTQKASGRKVRGACKAPNPSNASKRQCVRTILAGALSLSGHAGLNKLRFQGLLPNGKSLRLGSYNVSLTARDSGGLQSAAHSLSFSIVG